MRLLVVTNDYPPKPGGIQQYLGSLVAAYPDPVRILAPAVAGAEQDPAISRHHRSFLWPTRRVLDFVESEVRTFRPDLVFFGAPYPLPRLGPALRHRTGVPYAVLSHGAEITIPAAFPISRRLLAAPMRRADLLFSNGHFTAGRVGRLTRRRDVHVLGGGVDLEHFHVAGEPRTSGPLVVGCVSRFVPRKGQDRVIRAARRLRDAGHDVEVVLVGKGRKEGQLRTLAERLSVPTRLEVDVPWSRLGALYRDMDVFCMPCRSRWFGLEVEGLGLVFLEAAATGLPVLAGDSGGAPETVDPARTGFVVRTEADIVEAIEHVLEDRERGIAMGRLGRQRVERLFTWDRVVQRLLDAAAPVIRS